MIVFLICLGLYVLLSYSVTIERYGEKKGIETLIYSCVLLVLSFVPFAIREYINTGQIGNGFSYFVVAFGLFNRLFANALWRSLDASDRLSLMRSILVETWYFDSPSGYWFRRSKIVSLLDWAAANNKPVESFELENLKKFDKKYHWLWVEGDAGGPKPYGQHSALFLGRMYEPYKVGPYSKHDNL